MRDAIKGAHVQNACACQCVVCLQDKAIEQNICQAHNKVYNGVTRLWEECVCPKGEFKEWHRLNFLMGECVECGVGKLSICPNECFVNGSWAVAWKCFEQDTIGGDKQKETKEKD